MRERSPAADSPTPAPRPTGPAAAAIKSPAGRRGEFPPIIPIGQRTPLHEDLYHRLLMRPWSQFFVLACVVFLALNTLFALLYMAEPGAVANARPRSFEDSFFFSVQTMATIGYGAMAPATRYGHLVVTVEALAGTLYTALLTGLTFAKFSRPTARVLFSQRAVISPRDGVPHLLFRMANYRRNNIVEAQCRLVMLVLERTQEGEELRRPIELPLVRERNSLFILTWTAMHRIDERSPLYGEGALERLRAAGAQLFVSVSGTDETLGQSVHARYAYDLDDLHWNCRFVDVLQVLPDGTRVIDYRKFHDVVPVGPGAERRGA